MASLKFIMDVNDDPTESRHINKKDVASDHAVNMGHPHHRLPHHTQLPSLTPTALPPITLPTYDSNSGPSIQPRDISLPLTSSLTKNEGISWGFKGVNPAASSISPAVHIRSTMRRRSTASNDSADHTGYGFAPTSSTGGNNHQSHTPSRPMRSQSDTSELPMRLTPITGRVSRAKKGIPVHVCDICRPSKTFTRAEHLRRHQLGHGPPEHRCPYPNCDKAFHRSDLLVRHQQRHEQEGDKVPQTVPGDDKHNKPGLPSPPIGFGPLRSGQRPSGGLSPGSSAPCGERVLPNETVLGMQPESGYAGAQDPHHYPPGLQYNPAVSSPDINWPPQPPRILPLQSRVGTPIPDVPTSDSWRHSPSTTTTSSYSTTPVSGTEIWTGPVMTPFPNLPQPYPPSSNTVNQIQQETVFTRRSANSPSHNSGLQPRPYDHLIVPPRAGEAKALQVSYHQHQRGSSSSSIRSLTPPLNTPSHTQTLVLPATALLPRLDTRIQKDALLDSSYGMPGSPFPFEDTAMFDAMRNGLEGSANPSYSSDGIGYENGNLVTLGLPISEGCGFIGATLLISLMNPLHDAIPRYLAVYWERVHPLLPIVHRASFENAPEEVLRYAMAAVATQLLDDEEDRVKGSQLHELASREVKKILQWNIQVMQAVFLCEYFARFRGQNAVIRPSRLFEELYKRVSVSQFLTVSSFSTPECIQGSWVNDPSVWSPGSWSVTSDCSSISTVATTNTMSSIALRHFSSLNPAHIGNFPSSYSFSTSSPLGIVRPPFTSYHSTSNHHSSTFPLPSQAQLEVSEQTYLQGACNPQVLYHHPTMIDYTAPHLGQQLPIHSAWKNWVNAEARRRLLAACFFLDGHAAIYQQQPQAGQSSVESKPTHPTIPLMGSSLRLWEASSAAPWAKILAEDSSAGIPVCVPSPETMTPDFVSRQMSIDRMIILVAEYLRIPCRQGLTAPSALARKSSVSEVDPQLHYMNSQFSPLQPESLSFQPDFLQPPHSRTRDSLDMETRIGSLFPGCPVASTYLALHHTPLHDLLSVSGGSWLFTKKVLPAAAFSVHQRRLKTWAEIHHYRQGGDTNLPPDIAKLSVVKATKYAARSIVQFLSPVSHGVPQFAPAKGAVTEDRSSLWGKDISDYWALYVCALIFWAFGHRARSIPAISSSISIVTNVQQQQQHHHHHHPAKRQRAGNIRASLTSKHGSSAAADQRAMSWLRMLGADNITEEDIIRARSRHDSMSVVSLVRRRLEVDCIGGKNRLYVEAVAVLRGLEEDGEREDKPWF